MKKEHIIYEQVREQYSDFNWAYIKLTELKDDDPEVLMAHFKNQLALLIIYLQQLSDAIEGKETRRLNPNAIERRLQHTD